MTTDSALFVPAPPGWRLATHHLDDGAELATLLGWRFAATGTAEGWPVVVRHGLGTAEAVNPAHHTHLRAIPAGEAFDLDGWTSEVVTAAGHSLAQVAPRWRAAILAGPTHVSDAYGRAVALALSAEGLAQWVDEDGGERIAGPTRKATR